LNNVLIVNIVIREKKEHKDKLIGAMIEDIVRGGLRKC
jgi:hypothetical protein